jgi:hypothetical protein
LFIKDWVCGEIKSQYSSLILYFIMAVLIFTSWWVPVGLSVKLNTIEASLDIKLALA